MRGCLWVIVAAVAVAIWLPQSGGTAKSKPRPPKTVTAETPASVPQPGEWVVKSLGYANSTSGTISAGTVASTALGWQPTLTVSCSNGSLLLGALSHNGDKGLRYMNADLFMTVDEGGRYRLKTTSSSSGGREGWLWEMTPRLISLLRSGTSVFFWFDVGNTDTERALSSARFGLKGSSAAIGRVLNGCD